MTTMFATSADFTTPRHTARGVIARLAAAVAAATARANARRDYRRLLECDDILRDVGMSRDEVRQALIDNGGTL